MSEKANITVTIDASLASTWTEVPPEEGEEQPTYERSLSLESPAFRYSFLREKKRIKEKSGVLGVGVGDGWTEVPLVEPEIVPVNEPEYDEDGNLIEKPPLEEVSSQSRLTCL